MLTDEFLRASEKVRGESYRLGIPSIDPEDGYHIYSIAFTYASTSGRRLRAADLGAGIGYSTIWMAKALEDAPAGDSEVSAVEVDPWRAERLAKLVSSLKLFERVRIRVVRQDALEFLKELDDVSLDLVFVDVDKWEYPDVARVLEEKLRKGGIAIFHNAYVPAPPEEFFQVISRPPWTSTVIPTRLGLLVAVLSS